MKQELLDRLSTLQLPEHPLDQIINHFGAENVAEMTGRKNRLVKLSNGDFAERPRGIAGVPQRQTNLHELQNFQGKRKRIAVMSEVAATGDSMHSEFERRAACACRYGLADKERIRRFVGRGKSKSNAMPARITTFC